MQKLIFILMFSVLLLGCSDNLNEEKKPLDENVLKKLIQVKMNAYDVPGMQVCVLDIKSGQLINMSLGYLI